MRHDWKQTSPYSLQAGPWRIAKTFVHGIARYTLTDERRTIGWCGVRIVKIIGIFDTADEARRAAG